MKKRALALALAAAMSLGTITPVVAANIESVTESNSATNPVNAAVEGYVYPAQKTYYVTVEFDEMSFTYKKGTLGEWSQETLKYGDASESGWDKTTAMIKVKNRSDAAVTLNCEYTPTEEAVTGEISDGGTATLASAANDNPTEAGKETEKDFTLTISGTPTDEFESKPVGNVKLTVTKAGE